MTFGYAVLVGTIFVSKTHRLLPALFYCSIAAVVFNMFYSSMRYSLVAVSIALFLRLLPPFEACWVLVCGRKRLRLTFVGLAGSLMLVCLNPAAPDLLGYLSVRNIALVSMTFVCLIAAFINWVQPFGGAPALTHNLHLQAAWMALHSLISLTGKWSTANWTRYDFMRWVYVVGALAIVISYHRTLRNREALEGGPSACPPEGQQDLHS